MYSRLSVCVLCAVSVLSLSIQENEAPVVKILTPIDNDNFSGGALVPFSILVEDKEDGYSEYDEILPTKVLLTVEYQAHGKKIVNELSQDSSATVETLSLMGALDCFTCHKAKEKYIGPSFAEIAERYAPLTESTEYLSQKILKGAQGTWGEQIMPAHPSIAKEKIERIVNWILKNGSDVNFDFFSGTSGAFRTQKKPNDVGESVYKLTAFYTDNGIKGKNSKTGTHTIRLSLE